MFIINALITFSVLTAVLTAMSGRTRRRGEAPVLQRVTLRGWVSLGLMLLAFALGVYKESVYLKRITEYKASVQKLTDRLGDARVEPERQAIAPEVKDKPQSATHTQPVVQDVAVPKLEVITSTGEWDIVLNGEQQQEITSPHSGPMQIAPGTSFHFVIFGSDYSEQQLASLNMRVGNRVFPLLGTKTSDLKIDASETRPVQAYINNPQRLRDVRIKIFLRPSDDKKVEQAIKALVSPKTSSAGVNYSHRINTDSLRLRALPDSNGRIITLLANGTRVKLLLTQGNWSRVLSSDGHQGWVASKFLVPLN